MSLPTGVSAKTLAGALALPIKLLVALAAFEFLLLRIFMRISFLVEMDRPTASLLVSVGQAAFNAALLLGALAIALTAFRLFRGGRLGGVVGAALLSLLGLEAVLFLLPSSLLLKLAFNGLALLCIALAASLCRRRGLAVFAFSATLSLAYAATLSYIIIAELSSQGFAVPLGLGAFSLGEALALAAPIPAFVALRARWSGSAAAVATVAAALTLLALRGPFLPLVSAWSLYFTFAFHPFVYVAAVWLFVFVLFTLTRSAVGGERLAALGLALVFLGGLMLQLTYQTQLAILGVTLIALFFPNPKSGPPPHSGWRGRPTPARRLTAPGMGQSTRLRAIWAILRPRNVKSPANRVPVFTKLQPLQRYQFKLGKGRIRKIGDTNLEEAVPFVPRNLA